MEIQDDSAIKAAFSIGQFAKEVQPVALQNGKQAFIVPEGGTAVYVDPNDPILTRIRAHPQFDDAASFITYTNRFKRGASLVFANLDGNVLTAVFDYHEAAAQLTAGAVSDEKPDYTVHRATHPCPWALDWTRWREVDGKKMAQKEFGYFLEEMARTIASPDSAFLIECSMELKVDRSIKFKSGSMLQSGNQTLVYEETDSTTNKQGKMVFPETINIVCPIFFGGEPQSIVARIRYRLEDGALSFIVNIMNRKEAEQKAFQIVAEDVAVQTALPVLYGKP